MTTAQYKETLTARFNNFYDKKDEQKQAREANKVLKDEAYNLYNAHRFSNPNGTYLYDTYLYFKSIDEQILE
jgi:hypothetical protein